MGKKSLDKEKNISYETLASNALNINMQPFIFTLAIGAEMDKAVVPSAAEKFGMVLKGRLNFFVTDEEKIVFEEGDSIYCASVRSILES